MSALVNLIFLARYGYKKIHSKTNSRRFHLMAFLSLREHKRQEVNGNRKQNTEHSKDEQLIIQES